MKRTIIQGRQGTFLLSEPRPRPKINRLDVDERDDTWQTDQFPNDLLYAGAPHPLFPGLILDTADVEEIAPAFPPAPGFEGQAGDWRMNCHWLGDLHGTTPTKLIQRGMERSLGPNFDEIPFTYISWTAEPRAITGDAATDVISLPGNPFSNGAKVVLVEITGGSGLNAQSASSLGTLYYVINRTADALQLSESAGGSAVNFTTNITAGFILDARFALGQPHPDFPALFLARLSLRDNYTAWKIASCSYIGKAWSKPYHRVITVNGQVMTSSKLIAWDFTDGSTDLLNRSVKLPQVVVTDTHLTSDALTTAYVPLSQGEGGTPPNAPAIRSIFIYGAVDDLVYQWPSGWSIEDVSHVETLNSSITVTLQRKVYVYNWPVLLR